MSTSSDSVSSRPRSPPDTAPTRPFRFTWDPASKRGPASVSETTTADGPAHDTFAALPRVHVPNLTWSSTTQGFNAVSSVLNNPHKRHAPPKAHSPLPPVQPAVLPRVKRRDFDPYLRAVAPEWDRFLHAASPQSDSPSTPKLLTPLHTVPSVFFDPNFDLADSRRFDAVTERVHGDKDTSDPSSLSHALPLLEKLSHHADTIEQHLVREISLRSTSFFAALTNLQDLQSESEHCLDRIANLRTLLNDLDNDTAIRGLHIARKESRGSNLAAVNHAVRELTAVVEMSSVARGLVAAAQWGEALTVIDTIQSLLNPSPQHTAPTATVKRPTRQSDDAPSPLTPTPESPLQPTAENTPLSSVPLSSLTAFHSLPAHLLAMHTEISSSLTTDLVSTLKLDLLDRVNLESQPVENTDITLKDRLRPLLQGLLRTTGIREAVVAWRQVVTSEVRGIIKRYLPSFDPDEDEKSPKTVTSGLSSLLRSMSQDEFSSTVFRVYKTLLNGIEGLQVQNGILKDVLESHLSTSVSIDLAPLQDELSDILSSAADLSNKLVAKVVSYRSEQLAQLDLPSFLVFFNQSWDFVIRCEVICRRMIMGLRGTMLGQARLFLQAFHQSRINQSAKLVEDEQWNQMDVPSAVQHATDVLVDSAVRDSPDLVIAGKPLSTAPPSHSANGKAMPIPSRQNGSAAPTAKYIHIEERPYFCVSATGAVLGLLMEYLKLVVNLPMLNTDTMSRVIEFLKAFNSRTCQVVLGAGAMRSAGLKNITAKHLALASQSLSIMVALIPYVRETFRRHLSPNQAVMLVEFDKLKRDFQEHQNEIHSKLVAIMGDRISAHVKSLQAVNWEIPRQGDGVNDYMELLIKETVTLHKVLSRYLSAPIVEYVMSQVFAAINHCLSEEYGQIELQSQEAKDRMLADAHFLHQKLSVLKNVSAATNMLGTLVAEKPIPRKSTLGNLRTTAGPNERLRGLLSRRDSTKPDKPLPSPAQSPPTAPSNGATADEFVGDSDRVIPPPRSSSRSTSTVLARAEGRTSVDNNGVQGNVLQSEDEFPGNANPSLSALSLLGAVREPSGSNDDVQHGALPS
ncbi:Vps54-like protein-domain-containing protein [Boletus edulis BED1]|uniref:Vps54-like protein-domain-containing protein n=1 Tax=Boletus edulis BED1 TaxID=1328754 RepID=A0AAD4C3J6_BOLED|nr:Vps54-like protein-domain-containing protein [Boletus edulis BED1]